MSYTEGALAALDSIVAHLVGGGAPPPIPDDVWGELDAAGDVDAWDALEREASAELGVDWADPDAHDLDTRRWYDQTADPYARGPEPLGACTFMLGTHRPNWLYPGSRERAPAGPLFVSIRQLRHQRKGFADPKRRSRYPSCDTPYCIDSGGFTELRQSGGWVTSPETYAAEVQALDAQTGTLDWAATQDWMVEDDALRRTGLTVDEHQRRTVASFLRLRELAPEIRWLPVLQGQTLGDYLRHLRMFADAGVHLQTMGLVGVGSVCRRQGSDDIAGILGALAAQGLRLHGFGVKTGGLEKAAAALVSSDSLAWSLGARKRAEPGAANSIHVAEEYRDRMTSIEGVV